MWRRTPVAMLQICLALLIISAIASTHAQETASTRKVLVRVNPQYPAVARNLHLSGTVKVEAIVAANGSVKSVEVRGGHPLLAQSAQNAVREWKWAPAPQETREVLDIKFNPE